MSEPIPEPHSHWWQPGVMRHSDLPLFVMRVLFAFLLFEMIKWETGPFTSQNHLNGIAQWFDLTWLSSHPPGVLEKSVVMAFLGIYSLGVLPALGLIPALAFAIMIGTLVTSQSRNVNHSWQMVTMIALAQFLVYAWHAVRKRAWWRPGREVHQVAIYASTVVIAASYVVCGVMKLKNSDLMWIARVPYLSVQLLKTNWANYYNTLEKPPQWLELATQWVVDYPNLARLFFGTGLLIELLAFVILINKRWALLGGLAIVALHLSISQVMRLDFTYHIAAAVIFLIVPALWRERPRENALL